MPTAPYMPSPEDSYKYDDSSDRIQKENRVKLPGELEEPFDEVQTFDQKWIWILLGLQIAVVFLPLLLTGQPWSAILLIGSALLMVLVLMSSIKLYTRIDDHGIHYRMAPLHWKNRFIPWEEIDQVYVRQYSPLKEYGGWGIRYGSNGMALNIKGNQGIQVVRKNGKRLLIGTQRPEEATNRLEQNPLTV